MLVHRYSVLGEKIGSILLPIVGLMAGREAGRQEDKMQVDFEIFKILNGLNYLSFYFVCYHSNATTVLELHFSCLCQVKLILRCVFKSEKLSSHFFMSIPTIWY